MNKVIIPEQQIVEEQKTFITKVFGWMFLALSLTGIVAMWVASDPDLISIFLGNRILFYGLMIGELAMVLILAKKVDKMTASTATLVFLFYSAISGLTFSIIFVIYTSESIASTFLVTALTFGVMSLYGYFTKKDLTTMGNIALMGLTGIIIASVVNMFIHNETIYWVTTYIGILVFVALTAYDTQKIKKTNIIGNEGTDEDKKEAIMGALTLYLDFVNLFFKLLRLTGKRK